MRPETDVWFLFVLETRHVATEVRELVHVSTRRDYTCGEYSGRCVVRFFQQLFDASGHVCVHNWKFATRDPGLSNFLSHNS